MLLKNPVLTSSAHVFLIRMLLPCLAFCISSHTAVYSRQVVWLMSVLKCCKATPHKSRSLPRYPHLGAESIAQNGQQGISEIMSIPLYHCVSPLSTFFTLTLQLTDVYLAFPENWRQHSHSHLNKFHVLNAYRMPETILPCCMPWFEPPIRKSKFYFLHVTPRKTKDLVLSRYNSKLQKVNLKPMLFSVNWFSDCIIFLLP